MKNNALKAVNDSKNLVAEPLFKLQNTQPLIDVSAEAIQLWLDIKRSEACQRDVQHWVDQQLRLDASQRMKANDIKVLIDCCGHALAPTDRARLVETFCELLTTSRVIETSERNIMREQHHR